MRTSPRLWRYHLFFWSVAGTALFLSGLTQGPVEVALVRNIYLTLIGLLVGFPLWFLMDRSAALPAVSRVSILVGAVYLLALGSTVLINPVTFGQLGMSLQEMGFRQWFAGTMNYALVLGVWTAMMVWVRQTEGNRIPVSAIPQPDEQTPRSVPASITAEKAGVRQLVPVDTIDWIAAAGDYVEVHAQGSVFMKRTTMNGLEGQLPADMFARVHRSAFVRLDAVEHIEVRGKGEYLLRLRDGTEIKSGRSYRDSLSDRFGLA